MTESTHLWHPEWNHAYCGQRPNMLNAATYTTTLALVTCVDCVETERLVRQIHESTPEQFAGKKST